MVWFGISNEWQIWCWYFLWRFQKEMLQTFGDFILKLKSNLSIWKWLLKVSDINFSFTKRRIFSNQNHRGSLIHVDKESQDLITEYFVTFRWILYILCKYWEIIILSCSARSSSLPRTPPTRVWTILPRSMRASLMLFTVQNGLRSGGKDDLTKWSSQSA